MNLAKHIYAMIIQGGKTRQRNNLFILKVYQVSILHCEYNF